MHTDLEVAPVAHNQDLAALAPLKERAREFISQSKAANTLRAYRSDWEHFTGWCASLGLTAMPAEPGTVALYMAALVDQGRTVATIERRLSAISKAHQAAGLASPASMQHAPVSEVLKGIKRTMGTASHGKAPVLTSDLRAMLSHVSDGLLGIRDRAMLLVGFAGAFRRSELVGLDVEDVEFTAEGLVLTLRRSKTDQEGEGRKVGVPYGSSPETCPVRSLRAWLDASGIGSGPLFRSVNRHGQLQPERLTDKTVARVVQRLAASAGLDPAKFAGHSLRSGLATSAAIGGASERAIMNQTGHRSVAMVRRYIRDGSLFRENAAARVGL